MHKEIIFSVALAFSGTASAALSIFPAKGQSPEQQQQDEASCKTWAAGNSGYDPSRPASTPAPIASAPPSGGRLRGAAAGAAIGHVADGDTGKAAVAGAVIGGSRQRRAAANAQNNAAAASNAANAANATGQANYDKAQAACLEGKGYSVK